MNVNPFRSSASKFQVRFFRLLLALVCCASPLTLAAGGAELTVPSLTWQGNGQIRVATRNDAWLFDPTSGEFDTTFQCPPGRICSFSWSGKHVAVHGDTILHDSPLFGDGAGFTYGAVESPLSGRQSVPLWIVIPDDSFEPDKDELFTDTTMTWLDDVTLLSDQRNFRIGESACRTFDTASRKWSKLPGYCLSTKGTNLAGFVPGPDGLLAVFSSSEGAGEIDIFRWSSETGLTALSFPDAPTYRSIATVHFLTASERVLVSSPCTLLHGEGEPSCAEDFMESEGWNLYSWRPSNPEIFTLIRNDLPRGAVIDPADETRVAWPVPDGFCVRRDAQEERCFDLPN